LVFVFALEYAIRGVWGRTVVEALRYKPEGREFDSGWCLWNISLTKSSGRIVAVGSTQPLTELSTKNVSWGIMRGADNLTTFMCRLS